MGGEGDRLAEEGIKSIVFLHSVASNTPFSSYHQSILSS